METTGWQVEHQCPQCGAAVNLQEAQRLFTCRFCRVNLIIATDRYFQYTLPPAPGPETILYVPYRRFKGMFFTQTNEGIASGLIDITQRTFPSDLFPASLGLRPGVLRLRFLSSETPGFFLKAPDTDAPFPSLSQRIYIGETTTIIHTPFYIRDGALWDAVLREKIASISDDDATLLLSRTGTCDDAVRFLPGLCPNCGGDLAGDPLSVVFSCRNCDSAWQQAGAGFEQVAVCHHAADAPDICYLPFWRVEAAFGNLIQSRADLARYLNLPLVIPEPWEREPFSWLLPAFKIQPEAYLRIAKIMSLLPEDAPLTDVLPRQGECHPITLPLSEAFESLKIVLAYSAPPGTDRRILPPDIQPDLRKAALVFFPFHRCGLELIRPDRRLSISASAMKWGRGV